MTKSIIFDLYNTLIYSDLRLKPYLEFFREMDLNKEEQSLWRDRVMTENFGSFEDLAKEIDPSRKIYASKYDYLVEKENKQTFVFDDTYQVLDFLSKKYRIFLLSNISTPYKECFYNLGIDRWIETPFFSCDIGYRKPNPKAFLHVLESVGMKPSDTVMIGDSRHSDFEGASSVGIRSILKDKPLSDLISEI